MIIYENTAGKFVADVTHNRIVNEIKAGFERQNDGEVSDTEIRAWKSSMQYMSNLFYAGDLSETAGVAIEFRIPLTSRRVLSCANRRISRSTRKCAISLLIRHSIGYMD
jgi:hypothetical protein